MNPLLLRRRMMWAQGSPAPTVIPIFHATFDSDFSDSAGSPLVVSGTQSAVIDTDVKRIGTGSLLIDDGGRHRSGGVSYAYGKNMNFAQSSFTVAAWIRILSITDGLYRGICGVRSDSSNGGSWSCGIYNGVLNISFSQTGSAFSKDIYSTVKVPLDSWCLVKFQRDYENGKVYGYINGTKVIDETMTGVIYAGTENGFAVGNYHTNQSDDAFYGYIDDLKVYDQIV